MEVERLGKFAKEALLLFEEAEKASLANKAAEDAAWQAALEEKLSPLPYALTISPETLGLDIVVLERTTPLRQFGRTTVGVCLLWTCYCGKVHIIQAEGTVQDHWERIFHPMFRGDHRRLMRDAHYSYDLVRGLQCECGARIDEVALNVSLEASSAWTDVTPEPPEWGSDEKYIPGWARG